MNLPSYYTVRVAMFGMVPAEAEINKKAQTKSGPPTQKFLNLILRMGV